MQICYIWCVTGHSKYRSWIFHMRGSPFSLQRSCIASPFRQATPTYTYRFQKAGGGNLAGADILVACLCFGTVKLRVCSWNGGRALGAFPARGATESEQSESSVKRPIPQLLYCFFFVLLFYWTDYIKYAQKTKCSLVRLLAHIQEVISEMYW